MAPFVRSAVICLIIEIVLMIAVLLVIRAVLKKKNADKFAEIAAVK